MADFNRQKGTSNSNLRELYDLVQSHAFIKISRIKQIGNKM